MKRQTQRPVQLWLASTNSGKLREFSEAALRDGIGAKSLPGIDSMLPCIEDGLTFEENARKKAIHYSRAFDGLVFVDDSGLCVDALGGAPGVFSARYAGEGAADEANNARLIAELRGRQASASVSGSDGPLSRAYYDCVIALAWGGRVLITSEGRVYGAIIEHPRGLGGFGYDPHSTTLRWDTLSPNSLRKPSSPSHTVVKRSAACLIPSSAGHQASRLSTAINHP
jgi:XTP/dITP diphosphohydrolase